MRSGVTVLFVSHDYPLVKRTCDRVIVIENGKVETQGTPAGVEPEYHRIMGLAPA